MFAWFRETTAGVLVLACAWTLLASGSASAAGPPEIGAAWVEEVTATSAKLNAEINPSGAETGYYFEFVPEAVFRESGFAEARRAPVDPKRLEAGTTFRDVNQKLIAPQNPLEPSTAYRYRPLAENEFGTVEGPEHILVTRGFGQPFDLPDNRAWEMVSPIDKGGGEIALPGQLFGGGDLQAATTPGAVTYGSATAFAQPVSAPPGSQYISRRSAAGWRTENVSPPLDSAAYGDQPDGVPYRIFSADLARGALFGGLPCRGGLTGCPVPSLPIPGSGAPAGYTAYYLRSPAGSFSSPLTEADFSHTSVAPGQLELDLVAASTDLTHLVFESCAALTANAVEIPAGPGECDPAETNLYEAFGGGLTAVNVMPGDAVTEPGAGIGAPAGAVSADGSRIYWSEDGEAYLREGGGTVPLDSAEEGGVTFQTATPDGSIAFFTKGGRLYRFAAATATATDISPGGGVVGVLGVSTDGTRVYFQDAAGLELWHAGATNLIAANTAEADATLPSDYPPATATARLTPDGLHLAFLSEAALTGFDNVDATSKEADAEVYLFDATASGESSLICVSCNPTGERPRGPASIPGSRVNGTSPAYRPTTMTPDGSRLFFESGDSIASKDTNGRIDVYEWLSEGAGGCTATFGCVAPVSQVSGDGGRLVDASADAVDVYFITADSLVNADPGSTDLYDARVGGGFPEGNPNIICVGDSCQPLPGEPDDPTPATLRAGEGNPPRRILGRRKARRRRHGHHRGRRGRGRGKARKHGSRHRGRRGRGRR